MRTAPEKTNPRTFPSTGRWACSFRTQQDAVPHPRPGRRFRSLPPRPGHPDRLALQETRNTCTCDELASVSAIEQPHHHTRVVRGPRPARRVRMLLRKEVIQPHLPVRLTCYDFVPIASPTFDGSLHKGWATGFGCCRLS